QPLHPPAFLIDGDRQRRLIAHRRPEAVGERGDLARILDVAAEQDDPAQPPLTNALEQLGPPIRAVEAAPDPPPRRSFCHSISLPAARCEVVRARPRPTGPRPPAQHRKRSWLRSNTNPRRRTS